VDFAESNECLVHSKQLWVQRRRYAGRAFEEGWCRSIEVFVRDAEDTALPHGAEVVPVALGDDTFEGHAVPCSTPGEEKDVGLVGFR
jgi:hypothetical protein